MRTRTVLAVAATTLVLVGAVTASPASAASDGRRVCQDGEFLVNTHFTGLNIAPDASCHLHRVIVQQRVDAASRAQLTAVDSELATAKLYRTSLHMSHSSAFEILETGASPGVSIGHSTIYVLEVSPESNGGTSSPLLVTNSTVGNDLLAGGALSVHLDKLHVGHVLDIYRVGRLDLPRTGIDSDAFLQYLGDTVVCGVSVAGSVQVTGQLAATTAVLGGASGTSRDGSLVVDGDLDVVANVGAVVLDHVLVRGNLVCTENVHDPVLQHVTVTGRRTGQCAA